MVFTSFDAMKKASFHMSRSVLVVLRASSVRRASSTVPYTPPLESVTVKPLWTYVHASACGVFCKKQVKLTIKMANHKLWRVCAGFFLNSVVCIGYSSFCLVFGLCEDFRQLIGGLVDAFNKGVGLGFFLFDCFCRVCGVDVGIKEYGKKHQNNARYGDGLFG